MCFKGCLVSENITSMDHLFFHLKETLVRCFSGPYLFAQFTAVFMTYMIIVSGLDFIYYLAFDGSTFQHLLFSAVIVGGIVPVAFPLWILFYGHIFKKKKVVILANMLVQAVALGWIISSFYKSLTGRVPPSHSLNTLIDLSQEFQFGFMEGGIFWGWPSSHTTIAFAMATAVWSAYPKHVWIKYGAILYAFYMGLGVSLSIHWFSDAVAGAIFGTVIGLSIGKSFTRKLEEHKE